MPRGQSGFFFVLCARRCSGAPPPPSNDDRRRRQIGRGTAYDTPTWGVWPDGSYNSCQSAEDAFSRNNAVPVEPFGSAGGHKSGECGLGSLRSGRGRQRARSRLLCCFANGGRCSDHDANVENRQHFLERGLGSVRRWAGVRYCLVVLEWFLVVSWWASALASAARGWSAVVKGSEA